MRYVCLNGGFVTNAGKGDPLISKSILTLPWRHNRRDGVSEIGEKKILELPSKNSCGSDGLSTNFLKKISKIIAAPLSVIVRRAGLLWSQQDFEWRWSVPLFKCLTVLEFSFILFDLCLLITFFNFIMNYVPIVTFWIFTYHKFEFCQLCSVLYEVIELFIF